MLKWGNGLSIIMRLIIGFLGMAGCAIAIAFIPEYMQEDAAWITLIIVVCIFGKLSFLPR